jgi:hypothetical protein
MNPKLRGFLQGVAIWTVAWVAVDYAYSQIPLPIESDPEIATLMMALDDAGVPIHVQGHNGWADRLCSADWVGAYTSIQDGDIAIWLCVINEPDVKTDPVYIKHEAAHVIQACMADRRGMKITGLYSYPLSAKSFNLWAHPQVKSGTPGTADLEAEADYYANNVSAVEMAYLVHLYCER